MLNEMRLGQISEQTVQTFKSLARPLQFDDGLEVTELYVSPIHFPSYVICAV
jgi:ATP-dependent DNA helicase PIF1